MNIGRGGWKAALVVLLVAGLGACGSAPRTYHYTVDLRAAPPSGAAPLKAQLGVAEPRAAHLLRQDRIVYFTSATELNFYQNHRWSDTPANLVQSLLLQQMRGAGLFENVVPYRAQKGLDYLLRGRLLAMEEVDSGTEVSARFGLELELVRQEDSAVVWTGQQSCTRPVENKSVDAVVDAIGACAQESLNQLTASMGSAVAALEPRAAAKPGSSR